MAGNRPARQPCGCSGGGEEGVGEKAGEDDQAEVAVRAEQAEAGVAVVVSSSDAPELAAIADRCAVYFAGRQVAELHGRDVTEDNIVGASVGQTVQEGSRA